MTESEITLEDNKTRAEIAKLVAETSKINSESKAKPNCTSAIIAMGMASSEMAVRCLTMNIALYRTEK